MLFPKWGVMGADLVPSSRGNENGGTASYRFFGISPIDQYRFQTISAAFGVSHLRPSVSALFLLLTDVGIVLTNVLG